MQLTNFRCYRQLDLALSPGRTVIVGENAQGKSSLLEAVFLCATTRSPFAGADRELVRWDAGADDALAYGQVTAVIQRADGRRRIEVVLMLASSNGAEERTVSKRLRVDGAARRAVDALGTLRVVLFAPQDLALIDGPPTQRRRYLDVLLCQMDRDYCRALSQAGRVVTQRNHLLRQLRGRGGSDELIFWDEQLSEAAATVLARRHDVVNELARRARAIHEDLTQTPEVLEIRYEDTLAARRDALGMPPVDVREDLQAAMCQVLAAPSVRREEIARGATVVGPHRDDLAFTVEDVDMRAYGSRGQQRTVALSIKLAEAETMAEGSGEEPVMLLDDVLSELDLPRREFLLGRLPTDRQTLITTTDLGQVPAAHLDGARVVTVAGATVLPVGAGDEVPVGGAPDSWSDAS